MSGRYLTRSEDTMKREDSSSSVYLKRAVMHALYAQPTTVVRQLGLEDFLVIVKDDKIVYSSEVKDYMGLYPKVWSLYEIARLMLEQQRKSCFGETDEPMDVRIRVMLKHYSKTLVRELDQLSKSANPYHMTYALIESGSYAEGELNCDIHLFVGRKQAYTRPAGGQR